MNQTKELLPALKVGDKALTFTLPVYPGSKLSLNEFLGKQNIILAFYPKDNTPGCTKEMCSFSSDLSSFKKADTVILGISCDSTASHEKFATKHSLAQTLVSDVEGRVGKLYGVIEQDKTTASRVLFVIDKEGVIRDIQHGMPENKDLLAFIKTF